MVYQRGRSIGLQNCVRLLNAFPKLMDSFIRRFVPSDRHNGSSMFRLGVDHVYGRGLQSLRDPELLRQASL